MLSKEKKYRVPEDVKELIMSSKIVAVHGRMNTETVLLQKDNKFNRINYNEVNDEERKCSIHEGDGQMISDIDFCRWHEGYEIVTSVKPDDFIAYLESSRFYTGNMIHPYYRLRRNDSAYWEGYFFCNLKDVSTELEAETIASAKNKIDAYKEEKTKHEFAFGIKDKHSGRFEKSVTNKIIEILQNEKPGWIWYSKDAYLNHGSFFLDDHCTQGAFHPETPIEVARAASVLGQREMLVFLLWVLEGKIQLSGNKVGLSSANTCPKCGKFMISGATRRSTYEMCKSCGYEKSEDTGWD